MVRSIKNQYQGINAHLHSYWQARGGWQDFHVRHLGDLTAALKSHLLPMGYTAKIQPSLQIRRLDEPTEKPTSDVTIHDLDPLRPYQVATSSTGAIGELVLPTIELLEEPISEKQYSAIAIYEFVAGKTEQGEPVAWIELLSPSNKGNSKDAELYRQKRFNIVWSGIVFIELDYLHESSPTFRRLADYRTRRGHPSESGAHPYRIVVIDPRPDINSSEAHIKEFDVDTPIPEVVIPLNGPDSLSFNFGTSYHETFEKMLYGVELVDYSQLPLNFDRYSADDQSRIARRMLAVLEAYEQGTNLENVPLSVEHIPPETALAQLQSRLEKYT